MATDSVGGQGAPTNYGIEVVEVGGQSSAGSFVQAGRIVGGATEYRLMQKGQNWYLSSVLMTSLTPSRIPMTPLNPSQPLPMTSLVPSVPAPATPLTTPAVTPVVTPPAAIPPVVPRQPAQKPQSIYRPEIGSYLTNIAGANTIFSMTLDDREGATEYPPQRSLDRHVARTFWLRQEGGRNHYRAGEGQIGAVANRYLAQMGNELFNGTINGDDRWDVGVMAGYGEVSGQARSMLTGYRARSSVDGYSVGAYGTWYQDAATRKGLYLDSWLNYNWFNNTVNGEGLPEEKYKSRGVVASLESGYNLLLSSNEKRKVYLEPQAQLTWMGVDSSDHREQNGTLVQNSGNGNLQSRLGMRLYLRGHAKQDEGKNREFKPYAEIDWLHNTHSFAVRMDNQTVAQEGASNIGQLKLGVQGQLNKALNVWGGVALQVGDRGYHDESALIGVKYGF